MPAGLTPARTHVDVYEQRPLEQGWQAAWAEPDRRPSPEAIDDLDWLPARVPGTAAGLLRDAGREAGALDSQDWWFRTTFEAAPAATDEEVVLHLDGIATVAEIWLNGQLLLQGDSMFARHALDVGVLRATLRPRLDGDEGILSVRLRLRNLGGAPTGRVTLELDGPSGRHRAAISIVE